MAGHPNSKMNVRCSFPVIGIVLWQIIIGIMSWDHGTNSIIALTVGLGPAEILEVRIFQVML